MIALLVKLVPAVAAVIATAGLALSMILPSSTPPIPVPDPVARVETTSGTLKRVTLVPLGGAPVPIDVDGPAVAGLVAPDITVAVGMTALDELPSRPVVPNIDIRRSPLAVAVGAPAPPLRVDVTIDILDAARGLSNLASVTYGYETPKGGSIPPRVTAKLLGPATSGFIDPLEAKIESPGYNGPLDFNISAKTDGFEADFGLDFDPLPETMFVSEDPRADGLDFRYVHEGPHPDVHLLADAVLRFPKKGQVLDIGADIERLPNQIRVSTFGTPDETLVDYGHDSTLAEPDVEGRFRETVGEDVTIDSRFRVAGVPQRMKAAVRTFVPDPAFPLRREIDGVDFEVLDGDQIDSAEFEAASFPLTADPAPLTVSHLGPDQFLAAATKRIGTSEEFRAAGLVREIRHLHLDRQGDARDEIDLTTDIGNAVRPLRVLADLDDRGEGAPADAKRIKVDTTISPLPRTIHVHHVPSRGSAPSNVLYETDRSVDVTASALVAEGPGDTCGLGEVTCAHARIVGLPPRLELSLPAEDGTDMRVSHSATAAADRPDVRAVVDRTPVDVADRVWADVSLIGVPPEVSARFVTTDRDVLTRAEVHPCRFDFDERECDGDRSALGSARFLVRDRPQRGAALPSRPDTGQRFVTLLRRGTAFEAAGRVDDVREVGFAQRDLRGGGENGDQPDGRADGALGVLVDAGSGGPFDVRVDQVAPAQTEDGTTVGDATARVALDVAALPTRFQACVRPDDDAPPPADPGPADALLAACERTDVLGRGGADELPATPIALVYEAASRTRVDAQVHTDAPRTDLFESGAGVPDPQECPRDLSDVTATVADVPARVRVDLLTPVAPAREDEPCATAQDKARTDARELEVAYDATDAEGDPAEIDLLDLTAHVNQDDPAQRTYAEIGATSLPATLRGRLAQLPGGTVRSASFRACDEAPCDGGATEEIGTLSFLARNGRRRPALPFPATSAPRFATVVQRGDDYEVTGVVHGIREVAFEQRDELGAGPSGDDPDGTPDGPLGVLVDAGSGGAFDVRVDQVAPVRIDDGTAIGDGTTQLALDVATLPQRFSACVRPAADAAPPAEPGPPSALLAECERTNILGRGGPDDFSATPLSISYAATGETRVDADLHTDAPVAELYEPDSGVANPQGCPRSVADVTSKVVRVPSTLRVDAITPSRPAAAGDPCATDAERSREGSRALEVAYDASSRVTEVDLTADLDQADARERTYAEVELDGVPAHVRGFFDTTDAGTPRAAEFHACSFDFVTRECADDTVGEIGRLAFLARQSPDRGDLPPRPSPATDHASVVQREQRFEVAGQVSHLRTLEYHQRLREAPPEPGPDRAAACAALDPEGPKESPSALGLHVDAGDGEGDFRVAVDQRCDAVDPADEAQNVLGSARTTLDATVEPLPADFSACARLQSDEVPVPALPADPLMAECERVDVLGYGTEAKGALPATPLSLEYRAATRTEVEAAVHTDGPDLSDRDADGTPRRHATDVDVVVDEVPGTLRADLIPPVEESAAVTCDDPPEPGCEPRPAKTRRKLELAYEASETIDSIDFGARFRRADSLCGDPRPRRDAFCLSGRLEDVPADVGVTFDPDKADRRVDFTASEPAEGDERLSINPAPAEPLRLNLNSPAAGADPLEVTARVEKLSPHVALRLAEVPKPGGEPELGLVTVDACAPAGAPASATLPTEVPEGCDGVGRIAFSATNAPDAGDLELIERPSSPFGFPQDFTLLMRGSGDAARFRAEGDIKGFKQIGYSTAKNGVEPLERGPTSLVRAAFGGDGGLLSGLHAFVDIDDGRDTLRLDGTLKDLPKGVTVCLRPGSSPAAPVTRDTASAIWCDRQDAERHALQLRLDEDTDDNPDIDVRDLLLSRAGGVSVLQGRFGVQDLGKRIDALVSQDVKDIEIVGRAVDAPDAGEATTAAGNVAFDVRAFNADGDVRTADATPEGFPFEAFSVPGFDGGPVRAERDPEDEPRNDGNFVKAAIAQDGRVVARGSVPDVRRIELHPRPCEASDARFPAASRFEALDLPAPGYTCARIEAAPGKPLGLAIRAELEPTLVLSLGEGHLSQVPSGGIAATLAISPDALGQETVCDDRADTDDLPCRPPMLSAEAPQESGDGDSRLEGRLLIGSPDLLQELGKRAPSDFLSSRLDYEEAPRNYDEPGARVKLGTLQDGRIALRIGLDIRVPQFLDLDPPALFACNHASEELTGCVAAGSDGGDFDDNPDEDGITKGLSTTDIDFRLVAADDEHGGNPDDDHAYLGRAAFLMEPLDDAGQQLVVTGAPAPDHQNQFTGDATPGASSRNPEHPVSRGDPSNLGALVPGHLDARIFLRDDLNAAEGDFFGGGKVPQRLYAQVDGRVNRPLSLTLRLNKDLKVRRASPRETIEVGGFDVRRQRADASATQLTVRNAPGLGSGAPDYDDPTFRIRAELLSAIAKKPADNPLADALLCGGPEGGGGIDIPTVLTACLIVPSKTRAEWLDVQINADPASNGSTTTSSAARTVEAVAGPFGGGNDADLRGFREVLDSPKAGEGTPAAITPQASVRLSNFNLGARLGGPLLVGPLLTVGLLGIEFEHAVLGDLVLGVTGGGNEQGDDPKPGVNELRLGSFWGLAGLATSAGRVEVNTDYQATLRQRVALTSFLDLFRDRPDDLIPPLILGPEHQPLGIGCPVSLGIDEFGTSSESKGGISLLPAFSLDGLRGSLFDLLTGASQAVHCALSPALNVPELVAEDHPAPSFAADGRPVDDTVPAGAPASGVVPPYVQSSTGAPDLDVHDRQTRCGQLVADHLTVHSDGAIHVGQSDETDEVTGADCNGSLSIVARRVTVEDGGEIESDGTRGTGTGTPADAPGGSTGGGAGHYAFGGPSGAATPLSEILSYLEGLGDAAAGIVDAILEGGDVGQAIMDGIAAGVDIDLDELGVFGLPGGPYGPPATGPIDDFGSRGRGGSDGASGGRGGGTIVIDARDNIAIEGRITANGTAGEDNTRDCPDDGREIGAGGGSGGALQLRSSRVVLADSGRLQAHGGDGGDGAYGGGGGSGGRIDVITAAFKDIHKPNVRGGDGGRGECTDFVPNGFPGLPLTFNDAFPHRLVTPPGQEPAARIFFPPDLLTGEFVDERGPAARADLVNDNDVAYTNDPVELALDVIARDADSANVDVCRKRVAPDDENPFGTPDLEPDDPGLLGTGFKGGGAECEQVHFSGGPGGDDRYERNVDFDGDDDSDDLPSLSDGYYGLFVGADGFVISASKLVPGYPAPPRTALRIGLDTEDPVLTAQTRAINGVPGCPNGVDDEDDALCLAASPGRVIIDAADTMSGAVGARCRIGNAGTATDCQPGTPSAVELDGPGVNSLRANVSDRAGNTTGFDPVTVGDDRLRWFLDPDAPFAPVLSLLYADTSRNGWHDKAPQVLATSTDAGPSSGFTANAITLDVDGVTRACGSREPGTTEESGEVVTTCSSAATSDDIPDSGLHVLAATSRDRAGTASPKTTACVVRAGILGRPFELDPCTLRVDADPPTSDLRLAPRSPDGRNPTDPETPTDVYAARPVVSFVTTDGPSGSGVDPEADEDGVGSGVYFAIDNGDLEPWDPRDDEANTIPSGTHEVCWYAVDLAGNEEADADPRGTARATNCETVRVDALRPVALTGLTPATPGGANGFHDAAPAFDPSAVDVGTGVALVEHRVDADRLGGTDWRPAVPFTLGEGRHEVLVRAFDRAGNASPVRRTVVLVDTEPPTSALHLFPAQPDGGAGWYRASPTFAFATRDTALGSGVDLDRAPSAVRIRLDGGPWRSWDPRDEANVIPEGVHELCYFAIDVAGLRESDVEEGGSARPPHCQTIKVDATGPDAGLAVSPATADGRDGWRVSPTRVDPSAAEPPGPAGSADHSGLDRVELQLDGGPWTAASATADDAIGIPEGVHEVRVRAFDRAGNRSETVERVLLVDRSDPSVAAGSYPPRANDQGWFRRAPGVSLAGSDGRDSSGIAGAFAALDAGLRAPYVGPFLVGEGSHVVHATSEDVAGRTSPVVDVGLEVDAGAPGPVPRKPNPTGILVRGQTTTMRFTVSDRFAPRVRVVVQVYNALGDRVRSIVVPGTHTGGFRNAGDGQVTWDARDDRARPVLPGVYHYRVQAVDQAGNAALSTESATFVVSITGVPL